MKNLLTNLKTELSLLNEKLNKELYGNGTPENGDCDQRVMDYLTGQIKGIEKAIHFAECRLVEETKELARTKNIENIPTSTLMSSKQDIENELKGRFEQVKNDCIHHYDLCDCKEGEL